jgi:hypothetical protein
MTPRVNAALILCHEVKEDLRSLFRALNDREFYDIGFEVGSSAKSGIAFEHTIKELDNIEGFIRHRDLRAMDRLDWSIYSLVNYYDHLINLIVSRSDHFRCGQDMVDRLIAWRNTSGSLAQMICQMEDGGQN